MRLHLFARRAISGRSRIGLAHERAPLGMPIIMGPRIVVDARGGVDPDDGVGRAAGAGRQFGRVFACPRGRASHPVRLAVPVVAAVGSSCRSSVECHPLSDTGRRVHDRIGGPRQLSVRHRCVGQYSVARLSLCGNPLLRAHQAGRVHVRGQRASSRKSRRAQGTPDPFGVRGASTLRTRARRRLPTQKKSPARGGLLRAGLR